MLSRREVIEAERSERRQRFLQTVKVGDRVTGQVKNLTDFGAFVDLEGMDGLLHITDMSWGRINHPSEMLRISQEVEVQILDVDREKERVSLGLKQMTDNPWEDIEAKFPIGAKLEGRVTNITDYGAFVELEAGVEGLVHVSEMSWTKKNVHPGKIVSTSQQVEVMVLDVDMSKRRISLGLKQCSGNPWEEFSAANPAATEIEGEIRNITEFGLFVGLTEEIDGLVHLSDISWEVTGEAALEGFKKGDMVRAKILEVDIDKERISLGIKQLTDDPYAGQMDSHRKGEVVTCTVTATSDNGIDVSVGESLTGFIRRTDLSRDRAEQRADRYAVGEKVDAVITNIDKKSRKLTLSIKARETAEEKQAVEEYGSSDSGASLGDILGAALAKRESGDDA
ncbi:MAG: 30S ribosomal protein S1 [SAR116 cluster bacterium]|nr:MAG: 30S ribosomal protein S1 [SAR116 cluster bacterium]